MELRHKEEHTDQEHAVDARNVDLAGLGLGGALDVQPRQEAKLHGLVGEREGAGDDRLTGDHRGGGGEPDHGKQRPLRVEQVKWVFDRFRRGQQQRTLAEIIERESRESHAEPRGLDRAFAEMAEIGVERLATGHGEEDGAKRCKPNPSMIGQEHHAMGRIEGGEHAGVLGDMRKPADGKGDEPDERDRSEEGGDSRRSVRLHRE